MSVSNGSFRGKRVLIGNFSGFREAVGIGIAAAAAARIGARLISRIPGLGGSNKIDATEGVNYVHVWFRRDKSGRMSSSDTTIIHKLKDIETISVVAAENSKYDKEESLDSGPTNAIKSTFDSGLFFNNLRTNVLGETLLTASVIDSTQEVIKGELDNIPKGTIFVADQQIKGKGRGQNEWTSPEGCLMFSLKTQMETSMTQTGVEKRAILSAPIGQLLPFVQYIVTLSVIDAVKEATAGSLQLKIKWPNDIYSNDGKLKIGGVLSWSTMKEKVFIIVIGCGINLDNKKPTTCINELIQQHNENIEATNGKVKLKELRKETFLALIATYFEKYMDVLLTRGFEPLKANYINSWLHSGQEVMIKDGDASTSVTICGLTKSGYLLAEDKDSNRFELHPDGNSLDFFSGLISRKI